jgi:hypothetical protein
LWLNKSFVVIFYLLLQTHLQRKKVHSQVAYIQCLHAASRPEKDCIMGQLTQAYYESKNYLESTPSVPTISKEAGLNLSEPPMTLAVTGSMSLVATKAFQPIPCLPLVWLNSLPVQRDAMTDLGPSIFQGKKVP